MKLLFPLFILDIDVIPFDWFLTLLQRYASGELLPQISRGQGAERLGKQFRDRSPKNVWLYICKEAEVEGLEFTPYSFQHRYAYVARNIINKNGTYRSPKQIADAMGHDLETHLKSYSRFNTKDLENVFLPFRFKKSSAPFFSPFSSFGKSILNTFASFLFKNSQKLCKALSTCIFETISESKTW